MRVTEPCWRQLHFYFLTLFLFSSFSSFLCFVGGAARQPRPCASQSDCGHTDAGTAVATFLCASQSETKQTNKQAARKQTCPTINSPASLRFFVVAAIADFRAHFSLSAFARLCVSLHPSSTASGARACEAGSRWAAPRRGGGGGGGRRPAAHLPCLARPSRVARALVVEWRRRRARDGVRLDGAGAGGRGGAAGPGSGPGELRFRLCGRRHGPPWRPILRAWEHPVRRHHQRRHCRSGCADSTPGVLAARPCQC